jgi:ethanolamine utilization protein EutN
MRLARVIGTVTLNRAHPSFKGARLKLVVPATLDELADQVEPAGDTLVAWDRLGAGEGSWVALSEGPEAAQPFRPDIKPVEAYVAAILDDLHIDAELVRTLQGPTDH